MAEPLTEPATGIRVRTQVDVPLQLGGSTVPARVFSFDGLAGGAEHLAIGLGPYRTVAMPLVRPHSECLTGDVLGSARCDCGPQLTEAVERISIAGGYLLYLRQEGRGIGLYAKLDAYALQDQGLDTYQANRALGYPADARDYTVVAQMLFSLGVTRLALLSNNPDKAAQLGALGIEVADRVPTRTYRTAANASYLATKAERTGHTLTMPPDGHMRAGNEPFERPVRIDRRSGGRNGIDGTN